MLRTIQVCLLHLPTRQTAPCGPLLNVLEVRHALLHHHSHHLFGYTPEQLCITSGAILDVVLNTIRIWVRAD